MDIQLALREIERHTKVYKAFQEAENALIALASLDQHTKELTAVKKELEDSLSSLKKEVTSKQVKLKELASKIQNAEVSLEVTLQEVREHKLQEIEKKYTSLELDRKSNIASLDSIIQDKQKQITNHEVYLSVKQKEVAELEGRIVEAKSQIQRLLNGNA